jgi:hypothetical protein
MKLPTTLKVGPFTVQVKARPALEMDRNEAVGRFHGLSSLIEIRSDLDPTNTQDTLLHEALHAVMCCHGLRALLDLDQACEERLVAGLTPALLSLLRDNPGLVESLTQ